MSSYQTVKTPGDTAWFTHDRFGMFIHFGLYSMAARHEWVKSRECISDEDYQRYFKHFNPDMGGPREWVKAAKDAGMKYIVLTTKHHEGFCLFDSQYTDYKITNTPYGKDLVREYVDACHEEGIHVGFYYSLLDWHHPEYTIDRNHPMRNNPNAEELNRGRDMHKYAEYMRNQVRELLTGYGKVDVLWFDYSFKRVEGEPAWTKGKGKDDWEAEELIALARSLQPGIIIDNRTEIEQDIWTPEQFQPTSWVKNKDGEMVNWEACQTMSGSWGYHRDEMTWKAPEMLLQMLIHTVSLGGNMIMNVGPTARGYLDYRAIDALKQYGEWLKYNGRSIYGCTMAEPEFTAPQGCALTQSQDGKRLYLHLIEYPFGSISVHELAGKITYAQFLHDASEVTYKEGEDVHWAGNECHVTGKGNDLVTFTLPVVKPHTLIPVIEIFLK